MWAVKKFLLALSRSSIDKFKFLLGQSLPWYLFPFLLSSSFSDHLFIFSLSFLLKEGNYAWDLCEALSVLPIDDNWKGVQMKGIFFFFPFFSFPLFSLTNINFSQQAKPKSGSWGPLGRKQPKPKPKPKPKKDRPRL